MSTSGARASKQLSKPSISGLRVVNETPRQSKPKTESVTSVTGKGTTPLPPAKQPPVASIPKPVRPAEKPKLVPLLNRTASQIIKPLRGFEFITLMLIFIHLIFVTATDPTRISYFLTVMLVALTGSYIFMGAVDLVAQYSDNRLRVFPTTLFAACGIFFYGVIGIALLAYTKPTFWLESMIIALCFLLAILYILDVVLVLVFWKRTCETCEFCNNDCLQRGPEMGGMMMRPQVIAQCQCKLPEPAKAELATSVSNVQVAPASGQSSSEADHSSRKVSYARRRQYIDSPTNAKSAPALETAQVQTNPNRSSTIEAQTSRSEVVETPVQTASKCDLCHRQLDIYDPPRISQPPPQPSYPSCPAFMQLIHGSPYYTGVQQPACRCAASLVQVQQQAQQLQDTSNHRGLDQQVQLVQCVEPNLCGTLTNADAKQVEVPEGTITKLTFCIKSNSKTQSASQTIPYESAYTSVSPGSSASPSPKSRSIDYSRQSSTVSPDNSRSRMTSTQKADKIDEVAPVPSTGTSIVPTPSRKTTIDSSRRSTTESTRRSHGESVARKSGAESSGSRKSGASALRKSTMDNSEKIPRESDCSSRKCAPDTASRKSGESGVRQSIESNTDSSMRKSTVETLKVLKEQIEQSFDEQSIQDRKSEPKISVVSRPTEISRSRSNIEMKEVQTSPPETAQQSKASIAMEEMKEDPIEPSVVSVYERDSESPEKTSEELIKEEEKYSNNPVVQTVQVEQPLVEQWIGQYRTAGEEAEAYDKPSAEETEAFRKDFGITKDTTSQTIESILSPSNKPRKGHLFPKKNKINPLHAATSEDFESKESTDQQTRDSRATQEEPLAERKSDDVCPACKKPQGATGSAFQYYHIYRDKRGQVYCESCASPNTIKVVHKLLNSQKRLKCVGCGNLIQYKSVQTRQSSTPSESGDACSTCGRP